MAKYITQDFAEDLLHEHPGIPKVQVASELLESFCAVIRKRLLKEGEVYLSGVGKIYLKKYKASQRRSPSTGKLYQTPARNVIKFRPVNSLTKMMNIGKSDPVVKEE